MSPCSSCRLCVCGQHRLCDPGHSELPELNAAGVAALDQNRIRIRQLLERVSVSPAHDRLAAFLAGYLVAEEIVRHTTGIQAEEGPAGACPFANVQTTATLMAEEHDRLRSRQVEELDPAVAARLVLGLLLAAGHPVEVFLVESTE